jgi:hypothetical protein
VAHQGAIYVVLGASSKVDNGPLDHPVMAVSKRQRGALVVDINGSQLNGRFINDKGEIMDLFTIIKGDSDIAPLECSASNE